MKLPKVEMKAEALEDGKLYLWHILGYGPRLVRKMPGGNGVFEVNIDVSGRMFYFSDHLAGNLYGPIELVE